MGQEIDHVNFTEKDFSQFSEALDQETAILKNWFEQDSFEKNGHICGLELEAWLVDKDFLPSPTNADFLENANNDLLTNELAKFNFELNNEPHPVKGDILQRFHADLTKTWQACEKSAREQNTNAIMIGSLPTLHPDMLNIDNISPMHRYEAINEQIMHLRNDRPLHIDIKGKDSLCMEFHDVMLESASTSLQIHLQVNIDEAVRFYNAAHVASAFMVAVGANSPFLFGKELWDESRIAIFEQSVSISSCPDNLREPVKRVTFGSGYAKESILEPFLENIDAYPILLPDVSNDDPDLLSNLRLHNGCIWRWNRPLVGVGKDKKPHMRIEHRVVAAGPTINDVVANIALFLGLVHYLSNLKEPIESKLEFSSARDNFYRAAKDGLAARVTWLDGMEHDIQSLLLEEIIPEAKQALLAENLDKKDVTYYIDEIIQPRVLTARNGAAWQKSFVANHGPDFQKMVAHYFENQESDRPVHEWEV